jgi:hypothetical protein
MPLVTASLTPGCARRTTRTLPAVGRDHEDRVGRRDHHLAVADVGHADVDAVLRSDEDLFALAAEARVDDLVEECPPRSCRSWGAQRSSSCPLVLQESEWAQDCLCARTDHVAAALEAGARAPPRRRSRSAGVWSASAGSRSSPKPAAVSARIVTLRRRAPVRGAHELHRIRHRGRHLFRGSRSSQVPTFAASWYSSAVAARGGHVDHDHAGRRASARGGLRRRRPPGSSDVGRRAVHEAPCRS